MKTTRNPVVFAKDGEAFASSRDVAAFFGKNHRDVLRSIDHMLKDEPELGVRNFAQTPYIEPSTSQKYRTYNMDRDGSPTGCSCLGWQRSFR